ncbi:YadA-like family protein [Burkholderia sp. AU30280]|uniref:YadA family autotransporter adhesin n=1 Tax=Burkholderia sp. AU30280 TaxID=2879628 RepID=UPI001CF5473F|nr:ESPR-type extended signal peptide-containing protein [Burkholderia sp. AU30280]MCA8274957.1 YadA-like family protein [Burkholderia sp. AU30280]
MNKTYRNIWNTATGTWTAVAETARSRSKGSARAARQAVAALALGSASIGGAFAADACTTEDGASGLVDAAGVCKVAGAGSRTIGTSAIGTDAIGTMAALDDTFIKVNGITTPGTTATGNRDIAIGDSARSDTRSAPGNTISDYAVSLGSSASAVGTAATAIGAGAVASTGDNTIRSNATSLGAKAASTAVGATALGFGAIASAGNSVALGANSVADRTNVVSVGSTAQTRQITNLAAGTQGTDAVNLNQMTAAIAATDNPRVVVGGTVDAATSGRATNIAIGNGAKSTYSGTGVGTFSSVAMGDNANATGNGTVALGTGTSASGSGAIALGPNSTASGRGGVAIGTRANAAGEDVISLGVDSAATGAQSTAIGTSATANSTGSVALGNGATSSGNNATAIGRLATAGAVNATVLGGSAKATGDNAIAVGQSSAASGLSAVGIGFRANAQADGSVALGMDSVADRADTVSVGSSSKQRQIVNVAAGTQATDAVNLSQLQPVVTALGGGATIDTSTGAVTGPTYALANGGPQTTVGGALGALDGNITTINTKLDDLSNGTIGLVQQAGAGASITVGANTDGAAVDFTGTAGARKLTGVDAGTVSASSTDAVNGSQLHGVADSVASAIGGSSVVNADGSISAPSFTVGDGSGGTTIVHSVGDAVTNLDGRVTTNEGDIASLADQIGNGTVGLVQQAGPGANITVGANTDGTAVDFTGTAGARKLTGVDAGTVSASSTDAVNGSQLHGVADSVASAIGGGSVVNADGSISAPSFTVGDGSGGTTIVHSVGDAVTNLDGRVTTNEGDIASLADQIGNGTVGLVQQAGPGAHLTVGANTDGMAVNFAGTTGNRTLSGVANGVNDDDAVTIAQLKATGLIDYTGKEIAAVTYDDISLASVTFGGSAGTTLLNVAPGLIAAGSMEAVNGGQLYDLQEQFAQKYAELDGRVGDLEVGGGSGGGDGGGDGSGLVGPGTGGEGSLVVGDGAAASGENSSAIGQGSAASGDGSTAVGQGSNASGGNSSAIGQGSVASGENSSAIGQGAVASGESSTAIGQGSSATGSGSVAIGAGSVATEANTVSFGDGTAEGNRRLVNIADGVNASDAATKGQLDRAINGMQGQINDVAKNAYAGVAAAMAMPNLTPSQPGKTVVAAGAANYKSGSALAAGATYRTRDGKWLMNGAVSVTSTGDAGVRAQVGYEF